MCKLIVNAEDRPAWKIGDVISGCEDHEHEGEKPRLASRYRVFFVRGVPLAHPSVKRLFLRDQLPGKQVPERRHYLDLPWFESMAARKPGWTGAADQAVSTYLLALEQGTRVRFVPVNSLVVA